MLAYAHAHTHTHKLAHLRAHTHTHTRYKLCEDLLSKSRHYDWKLRAIKTTLYVAGGMKRAAPELTEDKVLLRALRDFNLGKLTADDTSIFLGLLNDLFPKTLELVPRAVDDVFDAKVRPGVLCVRCALILRQCVGVCIHVCLTGNSLARLLLYASSRCFWRW